MPFLNPILFTLRESHARGGQADVYPPSAEYPISGVAKGSQ
jgi:hypothetical protein